MSKYAGVSFLLRKSVWRRSFPRDELPSKTRFCSRQFFFELFNHVSKSDFAPLLNSSNFWFWSRFLLRVKIGAKSEIRTVEKWSKIRFGHVIIIFGEKMERSKIGFSKQFHHVRIYSFKHFSGAKKDPRVIIKNRIVTQNLYCCYLRVYFLNDSVSNHYLQSRLTFKNH